MSTVLTSEDDKRVSGGEVARCEVTIGDRVLLLSLSREDFKDHPRWTFRKNSMEFFVGLLDYLYKFYRGYATTNPRSHVLLECSIIT